MIIKKMRASFGKLHETLELHPGMNLLILPNEAGKSTWSAFLVAMLYGIDTSERANAQNQGLPAKERYKPWDGRAMEGAIELEWQGRNITIERATERRVPMGAFRAYETDSGTSIPELTGENCGRALCGVERSVFERTAFIRQLGLPVTGDAALEKRLSALVTTGEENGKSFSQLEAELKKYQNRLTGRAGKLPRLTDEADRLRHILKDLHIMQDEAMALQARVTAAGAEKSRLEALQAQAAQLRQSKQRKILKKLKEDTARQEMLCQSLEDAAVVLPDEQTLQALRQALETSQQTLQAAKMKAAAGVAEPQAPSPPPCFAQLQGQTPEAKAQEDQAAFLRLTEKEHDCVLPALLAGGVLLLCGLILTAMRCSPFQWLSFCAGATSIVIALLLKKKSAQAREARLRQAAAIAAQYGNRPAEEWVRFAAGYAALSESYQQRKAAAAEQRRCLAAAVCAAEQTLAGQLASIVCFAPEVKTSVEGHAAIISALNTRSRLESEQRVLAQMRRQCTSLASVLESDALLPSPLPEAEIDEVQLEREYRRVCSELDSLSRQLASRQGAISTLGDPASLEARLEELEEAIAAAQLQSEAAALALSALKTADSTLRARFSPQITADAGALLARLTEGKYPAVLLEPSMRLSVRETDGTVMRPVGAMSCGTADQMYLALRLAMCNRLLPEDVPLVLDDALVNFDDTRAHAALRLLEAQAQRRQIIFFTCRAFQSDTAENSSIS